MLDEFSRGNSSGRSPSQSSPFAFHFHRDDSNFLRLKRIYYGFLLSPGQDRRNGFVIFDSSTQGSILESNHWNQQHVTKRLSFVPLCLWHSLSRRSVNIAPCRFITQQELWSSNRRPPCRWSCRNACACARTPGLHKVVLVVDQ